MSHIEYPVKLKDVPKVEQLNNISINVYELEGQDISPLYISKSPHQQYVHLLLYKGHYCLVGNLDGLLFDQRKKHKLIFCPKCLFPCYSEKKRAEHVVLCRNDQPSRVEMPTDTTLEFTNIQRMQRSPYVIYADFECILEKIDSCDPNPSTSYTQNYQKHTPCGYGLVETLGCCNDKINIGDSEIYRGDETVKTFLRSIIEKSEGFQEEIKNQST